MVENRTGGGGLIAAEHVINSPADGYTVYVGSHGSQAIHPHLTKLSFDPVKAFAPVIYLATTPTLLVMHPSVPAKSLKELIALTKANPGKYTYASQGNGSSGHVTAEQFKQLAGVDLVHVPYKGAAPAVRDLVAGHVSLMFDTVAFSQEQVSGRKAARARSRRRRAREVAARGADDGGSGPARDAGQPVVRPGGGRGHAASGHRLAQPRGDARRSPPRTCRIASTRRALRCRSARRKRSPRTSPRNRSAGAR